VPLQVGLLVASAIYAFAENPEMAMDKMMDDELRALREQKVAELKERVRESASRAESRWHDLSAYFLLHDLLHSKGIRLHQRARI
jgi:hypothetical protein